MTAKTFLFYISFFFFSFSFSIFVLFCVPVLKNNNMNKKNEKIIEQQYISPSKRVVELVDITIIIIIIIHIHLYVQPFFFFIIIRIISSIIISWLLDYYLDKRRMIHFIFLQNRMGVTRLSKFYVPVEDGERERISKEVHNIVNSRDSNQANFVEFRNQVKLIYRRYAGLFFVLGVDEDDNDFSYLELIHLIVEIFDLFFTDVCELDLVFNFHKVHMIVDEVVVGGEIQELCRQNVVDKLKKLEVE